MGKKKHKRKKQQTENHTEQKPPDTSALNPMVCHKCPTENTAERQHQVNAKKEKPMKFSERIKSSYFTNWCLVVFTGALAVVAIYQFIILKGQLHTMQIDQRAWIYVMVANVPKTPVVNEEFNAFIQYSNTGKTPAKKMRLYYRMENVRNGESPDFEYSARPAMVTTAGSMLPNAPNTITVPLYQDIAKYESKKLTVADVEDLLAGKTFIAIHGRAEYMDIFGNSHWSKFCIWKAYCDPGKMVTARSCSDYNDTDDN
jgi:hypothetical protein